MSTALITGAGSGIGRGVALELDKLGMRLALLGRDEQKLAETRRQLSPEGRESALLLVCDIADRAAVDRSVAETLKLFGSIEVLVCNAGTNVRDRALDKLSPADFDKMIATNLTGSFNLAHAVLPQMRARGSGTVIQISSISGMRVSPLGGVGYSASKFGQAALGIGISLEDGARGIRSTVIYPGEVDTPILDNRPVPVPAERRRVILQPEDVAAAVRFVVTLNPRANVLEIVIKPTVDAFS